MPPKLAKAAAAATDSEGRKQPTQNEAFLFYAIIKHMKGKPEIDWNAVAADTHLKNAETAKVRYGQIKRKLGLDTWTPTKPKPAAAATGEDGVGTPATPTPKSSRSRKTAATPSTPGTGAGVKKRGRAATAAATPGATPSTGRGGRKAKSQALLNLHEQNPDSPMAEEDAEFDDASLDDEMLASLATPTKGTTTSTAATKPRGRARPTKPAELSLGRFKDINTAAAAASSNGLMADYSAFPAVLPEMVLARRAVLVFFGGAWTLAPASVEAHARWLARLPANVQTRFYTQAHEGGNQGAEDDDGGGAGNRFTVPQEGEDAAVANDGGETIGLGYLTDPANGGGGGPGASSGDADTATAQGSDASKDANMVGLHPVFVEEMELAQEVRDRDALFGGAVPDIEEEEDVGAV